MVVQLWNIDSPRRTYIGAHGMNMLITCDTNCSSGGKTDMWIGGSDRASLLMGYRRLHVNQGSRKPREGPKTLWNGWQGVIDRNFDQSSRLTKSPFLPRSYALAMASCSFPLKHSAVSLEYIIPPLTRFCLDFHPLHTLGIPVFIICRCFASKVFPSSFGTPTLMEEL
jgi:hypothetical protein